MAKKRSKTAKQKQAKAARQFGVSVKKGGGREKVDAAVMVDASQKKKKKNGRKWATKPNLDDTSTTAKKKNQSPSNEQSDFLNQMKGLEERRVWQRNRAVNDKKAQTQQVQLAEATLVIDDRKKSTQRLVHETEERLTVGMNGIGVQQQSSVFYPTNKLQVMAAQQRDAWAEEDKILETDNPYAALEIGDSDDDGEEKVMLKPQVSLFQFAPPSFAVGVTDVDPDL